MDPILQDRLPLMPWMDPRTARLPGIQPLAPEDWLRVDTAHAGQMAERDRLIAGKAAAVHALLPRGVAAARELMDLVLGHLARNPAYRRRGATMQRPDGAVMPIDRDRPLLTLGRLVQEDLCLLEQEGAEHVMTGAILCFPASWTLAEKIGRPLTGIHRPVQAYDESLARRVQRLFDAIRPEQPLWRANSLLYADPALHQPRREGEQRARPAERHFVRVERQCLLRLPESGAVVFSIHTSVVRTADVPAEALERLRALGH